MFKQKSAKNVKRRGFQKWSFCRFWPKKSTFFPKFFGRHLSWTNFSLSGDFPSNIEKNRFFKFKKPSKSPPNWLSTKIKKSVVPGNFLKFFVKNTFFHTFLLNFYVLILIVFSSIFEIMVFKNVKNGSKNTIFGHFLVIFSQK